MKKDIPVLLFLFLSLWLTSIFNDKLVPQVDMIIVSRDNPHRVIAKQEPFIVEVVGGNISPKQDEIYFLKSQIIDSLKELDNANFFPFIMKWFLTFNIDFILKSAVIKDSNIKITPYITCNDILPPKWIIFSEKNISLQNFLLKVETQLPEVLNSCIVYINSSSTLPTNYVVTESYGLTVEPTIANFLTIFVIVVLGFFALLPVIREGFKFFKTGFNYFI